MSAIEQDVLCTPSPDKAEINKALNALFDSRDVIELRALYKGRRHTAAGYFDSAHRDKLTEEAVRLNQSGAAVYVNLNPIDPQLQGRYSNRIEPYAQATATDVNVTHRRWFLLDFDPVRPKDTGATIAQLKASKDSARACYQWLKSNGWPEPLIAESGNGMHLLYALDLPNDAEAHDLIKGALAGLAQCCDTEAVRLDQAVFNAGRITKLYGTVANKGDHTTIAPWRQSRLLCTPARSDIVTPEQLRALHPPGETELTEDGQRNYPSFDLDGFLARLGIEYTHDIHEGRDRYRLAHCPFDASHGKGEAAVLRRPDGGLGFHCFHNSCADKSWQDLRALVDGPRERRSQDSKARTHRAGRSDNRASGGSGSTEGACNSQETDWPEPLPIPEGLLPVKPFDLLLLPETLRPWAQDIVERVQCAPDFVGVGLMGALAGVIGRRLGIRPQARTDWTIIANLWALIIGRLGVLKSPAMEASLAPLKRLGANADESFKAESVEYERLVKVAKLRTEAAEKAARETLRSNPNADVFADLHIPEPDAPIRKRYIANDTTAAALGKLLRQNPNGLLVYRDELVSLLKTLDREDNAEARGFYLTAWNGDSSYTIDRIGRGMHLQIPAVCLSVLGSTQPGRIADYLRTAIRGGAGDDGLIQRFGLLVWPDTSGWQEVDRWPDTQARQAAHTLFDYLDQLDPTAVGAKQDEYDEVPYLRFDDRALDLFREWRADLEAKLRSDELHPALEAHLAKYRKLVPGLAFAIWRAVARARSPRPPQYRRSLGRSI